MAAIVTGDIRVFNAQQFIESVSETANASLYTFIGQPRSSAATAAADNVMLSYNVWDNMIALKRINGSSDVKMGIRKYVWASGNVYTSYDQNNSNLYLTQYFVVNSSDNKVYKCLGNAAGAASTVAPTDIAATTGNTSLLSDGYRWKYMSDITGADLAKFGTPSFIPLTPNAVIQAAATPGGILHIDVIAGGSGYVTQPTVTILGDGTGAAGTVGYSGGAVANITMTVAGTGYRFANAFITGGGGANANLKVSIAPVGGHGSNPLEELGAHYAILNTRIETSDVDFPTGISYYQVGLIRDPLSRTTGLVSYESTMRAYKTLVFTGSVSGLVQGNVITGATSGGNAYVLAAPSDATANIHFTQYFGLTSNVAYSFRNFVGGEIIKNEVGTTVGTTSFVSNNEVLPNSGRLLYVDNRAIITRATNQSESISIILEF